MLRLCAGSQYSLSVEQGWKRHESEVNHSPHSNKKNKIFLCHISASLFQHEPLCDTVCPCQCVPRGIPIHVFPCGCACISTVWISCNTFVCVCVCISVWLYLWAIHDAYLTVKRIKKLQLGPMILLDYSRLSSSSLEKANQWLLILAGKKKKSPGSFKKVLYLRYYT